MLSHIDETGRPRMVDVGEKTPTRRAAEARAIVELPASLIEQFREEGAVTAKGPVFATAVVAGVMAVKRTHELIPFCHPLGLDDCQIDIDIDEAGRVVVRCRAAVTARTGVEMEALTGASVAALTIYDMCKAASHDIVIRELRLLSKQGGKSDYRFDEG